jgi:hypothetical protein
VQRRKLDHVYAVGPESSSPDVFKIGEDSGKPRVSSEEGSEWGAIFMSEIAPEQPHELLPLIKVSWTVFGVASPVVHIVVHVREKEAIGIY